MVWLSGVHVYLARFRWPWTHSHESLVMLNFSENCIETFISHVQNTFNHDKWSRRDISTFALCFQKVILGVIISIATYDVSVYDSILITDKRNISYNIKKGDDKLFNYFEKMLKVNINYLVLVHNYIRMFWFSQVWNM